MYEPDKFILSNRSVFVGKGYVGNDTLKLNIITPFSGNVMNDSFYILVYYVSSLWHNCLRHVNRKRLKEMSRLELISDFDGNIREMQDIYVN